MISNIRYLFFFLFLGLISCSQEEEFGTETSGDGTLSLSVSLSDKINVVESRSLSSSDTANLANDCRVRIYDSKSLIRKYEGIDNVPSSIVLPSGNYSIRVTAGDSTAASFKKKFFEGKENFSISYGKKTEVDVDCRILNTVVTVTWDESLKEAFSDYKVTVSSTTGKLVYTKDSIDASGYFCVPDNNRNIFLEFEGKPLVNEEKFILRDTLLTKKSTQYILKYRYNDNYISGGGKVDVSVDENPLRESSSNVDNKQRASIFFRNNIEEKNLPINEPVYLLKGSNDEHTIWVSSKEELTSFTVECDNFTDWGLDATQYELIGDNVMISNLFSYQSKKEAEKEGNGYNYYYKLGFTPTLMSNITSTTDREYSIKVKAVDSENRVRTETINLVVSNATVNTNDIINYEVWTNRAILRGETIATLNGNIKFRYKKSGASDWIDVVENIQSEDNEYSVEIKGLSPDTEYEYQICDGSNPSNNTITFRTDSEFQPENAGFEYTSGSLPTLIYGDGQSMWWDTGNHGSKTARTDVTTPDTSVKHSGKQSLLLSSQFANIWGIGKFAAGNVFVGKYLKTDGTDGVLGWGRPCKSRPTAMKLWVRYIPGTVDEGGSHIANGKDNGHIYVAVGDWSGMEAEGETWPFVVRTKNQESLFSTDKGTYSGDGIIGYGEQVFDSNYEDNGGLKELTIPLNYDSFGGNRRKPTSIIIVASASRYGDYFEGSTSSRMWLDDIELIYE